METLNDYIKRLQTALEKKRPYVTYNRDKYHASLVVSAGFRHAEESIRIVSHKLDPDVYASPGLVDSVSDFLKKAESAKLSILIEQEVSEDHPILRIGCESQTDGAQGMERAPSDVRPAAGDNVSSVTGSA